MVANISPHKGLPLIAAFGIGIGIAVWWATWHNIPAKPDFETWLKTTNRQAETAAYTSYLNKQGVGETLPLPELLSAARDWQKCGADPFVVPPKDKWQNMVNTLKLLRQLQLQNILPAVAITSSYRYPELNRCAGGSAGSKHLSNGALDMRFKSPADGQQTFPKLCKYWRQHGAKQAMGLGFYPGGQIHIDTQGFRTWGQDYTTKSSPCQR
ncbi:MAG: D-Ala-D-Ala carboxypeptidase family metallohydrolase [Thiothrix sp.]|uniref:D-Ala-D-Ala carboxypeptidase family metallohydrolase n=1 Tax=Thiothrix sp. TaxID=1032 RepID=UPI00261064CB|nr:D-Ala-D-Ala carboxypeptidase family metallohydrolase [Thiothrix sp.]MDD5395317.1 D-Ala-D-Ala carboxypeptidase family metallohydrolase [Thiothrix sp.]